MPLPVPKTWEDGEDPENTPSADDLNLEWRDSFNFLLGYTRPFIYLESNVGQALASGVQQDINWQVETVKRGGMVHSANAAAFTVPYTGQYAGYMYGSAVGLSNSATRLVLILAKNVSTGIARVDQPVEVTASHEIHGSFTADLAANDSITCSIRLSAATGTTSTGLTNRPKLVMYYVGDYV